MAKQNWDSVADEQFKSMPKSWQSEWSDLREVVNKRH